MTTTFTNLELDSLTKERVERLASAHRRTTHAILCESVQQYIEREERRDQLRLDAQKSWAHYQTTGLHVTNDEADDWLAKLESGEDIPSPSCHV